MMMSKDYKTNEPKEVLENITQLRNEIKEEGHKIYSGWEDSIQRNSFRESAENLSYYF